MKNANMLIKTTYKSSLKVKRIRKKCIKIEFLSVFSDIRKIANF